MVHNWIVKPTTPGEHNVNVIIEGKSTPIKFRVKYLPNPASLLVAARVEVFLPPSSKPWVV
jgi:hypothetical protein